MRRQWELRWGNDHHDADNHADDHAVDHAVDTPAVLLETAAKLCLALGTDGLRGELTLVRSARALAALEGKSAATLKHLRAMAPSVLRHRLRRDPLDESSADIRVERVIAELFKESKDDGGN